MQFFETVWTSISKCLSLLVRENNLFWWRFGFVNRGLIWTKFACLSLIGTEKVGNITHIRISRLLDICFRVCGILISWILGNWSQLFRLREPSWSQGAWIIRLQSLMFASSNVSIYLVASTVSKLTRPWTIQWLLFACLLFTWLTIKTRFCIVSLRDRISGWSHCQYLLTALRWIGLKLQTFLLGSELCSCQ